MRRATILVLLVLAGVSVPITAALAQVTPSTVTQEAQEKAKEDGLPVGAVIVLGQVVGGGSFTADPYVRRTAVTTLLSLGPYWDIVDNLRLSGKQDILYSMVENYQSTVTYRNRTMLSDTTLDLSHLKLVVIPGVDVTVNAGLSLVFPTSPQSQYRDIIMNTTLHAGLVKKLGVVTLAYVAAGFKNFNRYTSPTVSLDDVGDHVVLARFGGNEQLTGDLISVGGNNVEWGVLNSFTVSVALIEGLTFTVVGEVSNSWTYDVSPSDEFTSEYAKGGRGQRDTWHGVLDLTYALSDNWAVSMGTDTVVAPKTADNGDWVFPWANFSNNDRNNSSVYAVIAATY